MASKLDYLKKYMGGAEKKKKKKKRKEDDGQGGGSSGMVIHDEEMEIAVQPKRKKRERPADGETKPMLVANPEVRKEGPLGEWTCVEGGWDEAEGGEVEVDLSPPRQRNDSPDDLSPPRRRQDSPSPVDLSPPRRRADSPNDLSPPRRQRHDSPPPRDRDLSPPRRGHADSSSTKGKAMGSGMVAGLATAEQLAEHYEQKRKTTEEKFRKMDPSMTGEGAKTVYRDKRGRKLDMLTEYMSLQDDAKKPTKKELQVMEWGKGLVQKRMKEELAEEEKKEMAKPFARYADDEDLEAYLKSQERAGDPMLEFIKKDHKEKGKKDKKKKKKKHMYRGPPGPSNRFGIQPGYRWDGVDRSNGYETKYFQRMSEKVSIKEQAYKWSVEGM